VKIGILGGTGDMGRGLCIRLALKHEVLMGSRTKEKAIASASGLYRLARGFYQEELVGSIKGVSNEEAISQAEIVVVTLPAEVCTEYLGSLRENFTLEKIVVSTVVPMTRRKRLFYWSPLEGEAMAEFRQKSAAEIIQGVVTPSKVVTAFQTVPASYLSNIDATLNIDVLIASDDELALAKVSGIIRDIPNLRPLKVGPLENSKFIEAITPLLLNVAVLNGLQDPTIRVVPWMPKLE